MKMNRTKAHKEAPGGLAAANERFFKDVRREEKDAYLGDQMTFHFKPNKGGTSTPCDVCGVLGMREGTRHRALAFGEWRPHPSAISVKRTKNTFGTDESDTYLDSHGEEATATARK